MNFFGRYDKKNSFFPITKNGPNDCPIQSSVVITNCHTVFVVQTLTFCFISKLFATKLKADSSSYLVCRHEIDSHEKYMNRFVKIENKNTSTENMNTEHSGDGDGDVDSNDERG